LIAIYIAISINAISKTNNNHYHHHHHHHHCQQNILFWAKSEDIHMHVVINFLKIMSDSSNAIYSHINHYQESQHQSNKTVKTYNILNIMTLDMG